MAQQLESMVLQLISTQKCSNHSLSVNCYICINLTTFVNNSYSPEKTYTQKSCTSRAIGRNTFTTSPDSIYSLIGWHGNKAYFFVSYLHQATTELPGTTRVIFCQHPQIESQSGLPTSLKNLNIYPQGLLLHAWMFTIGLSSTKIQLSYTMFPSNSSSTWGDYCTMSVGTRNSSNYGLFNQLDTPLSPLTSSFQRVYYTPISSRYKYVVPENQRTFGYRKCSRRELNTTYIDPSHCNGKVCIH